MADQVLYLAARIAIICCVPIYCGPIFTIILGGAAILSWGFLCRWILLLPIDLVLGKKEKTVYFSGMGLTEHLEFFPKTAYDEWKFYYGSKNTLTLLFPTADPKESTSKDAMPPRDAKVRITY